MYLCFYIICSIGDHVSDSATAGNDVHDVDDINSHSHFDTDPFVILDTQPLQSLPTEPLFGEGAPQLVQLQTFEPLPASSPAPAVYPNYVTPLSPAKTHHFSSDYGNTRNSRKRKVSSQDIQRAQLEVMELENKKLSLEVENLKLINKKLTMELKKWKQVCNCSFYTLLLYRR